MSRADVIVVGGGVNGCSIAYRLAEAGRKVLLLERRGLASGASGRNGGLTGGGSAMLDRGGRVSRFNAKFAGFTAKKEG